MIQAHMHRKTKVHRLFFDPFHFLSFLEKLESRRVSDFIQKLVHTLKEDSSSAPECLMLHSISCIIHLKSGVTSRAVKWEVYNGL